jgi:hypothetical protein
MIFEDDKFRNVKGATELGFSRFNMSKNEDSLYGIGSCIASIMVLFFGRIQQKAQVIIEMGLADSSIKML